MQPTSKATRHQSVATPSQQIRRVHEDPRAHQSYQTNLRQALTHIYDMGVHLTAFRQEPGQTFPAHGRPTSKVGRPGAGSPRAPPTLTGHVAVCGWCSRVVWLNSRAKGWWFPPIYMREGASNEDIRHLTLHSPMEFPLELRGTL